VQEVKEKAMSEGVTKTGIKGLDSILLGGIPRTNVILVQGVTGSGKTLILDLNDTHTACDCLKDS
jgi:RecA/RadA recombinase